MHLRILLLIIICVAALHSAAQYPHDSIVKKLNDQLRQSANDSNKIKILFSLGEEHSLWSGMQDRLPDSALTFYQQAYELSHQLRFNGRFGKDECYQKIAETLLLQHRYGEGQQMFLSLAKKNHDAGNKVKEAYLFVRITECFPQGDHFKEKIFYLQKAVQLYTEAGQKEGAIEAQISIANAEFGLKNTALAQHQLQEILINNPNTSRRNIFNIYYLLSTSARYRGDFTNALTYSLKNLQNLEAANYSFGCKDIVNGDLGLIYHELGENEKSIECYKISLAVREMNLYFRTGNFATAAIISELMTFQNRPQEGLAYIVDFSNNHTNQSPMQKALIQKAFGCAYDEMNMRKKAEEAFLEMIRNSGTAPDDELSVYMQMTIGKFYLNHQQFDKAEKYLRPIAHLTSYEVPLSKIRDIHQMLYQVDSAEGNYLSAIHHLQLNKLINDSIFNETKMRQIEELQIQYETTKKDRDLELNKQNIALLTKEGLLQKKDLRQTKLVRNVTVAGILLLLVIIGLLYSRYLLSRRTKKVLEEQQKEISSQNNSLQKLLNEKEWLLKEIHHRVKNNLQTVISLLNSQSAYLDNEAAISAIKNSQHRIHAMSLMHQKLYGAENLSSIDMPVYIHELMQYLRDAFNVAQRIRFDINIAPLQMDVMQAVPMGLILNEAVTNSLKYAFPDDMNGAIEISLSNLSDHKYLLVIKDNGIGLPPDFNTRTGSLGMSLLKGLSEDLEGELEIINNNGTTLKIVFTYETPARPSELADLLPDANS